MADVLGVVCDFCAVAMNKIFGKREEVAAIYVDLDTKALSLVLVPGASLSDETIAELAVQAGYRIADIRRGDAAWAWRVRGDWRDSINRSNPRLFGSASTLLCCALPALLISLGAGAVMAGSQPPYRASCGYLHAKNALFVLSGLLMVFSSSLWWRRRHAPCRQIQLRPQRA